MKPVCILLALLLSGCIPIPIPFGKKTPAPVAAPENPSESVLETREPDSCGAVKLHTLIGQNEGMIRTVRTKGGYRVLPPGAIVTQEYDSFRLNLHVDDKGTVQELSCG